jgi:hypothetical protein
MNLRSRAKRAVQTARTELADAVRQAGDQNEINQARQALARRKLPPEERAAAKAQWEAERTERKARDQQQARERAAVFKERSERAEKEAAEAQTREKATLRRDGRFLGTTQTLDGVRVGDVCKVVLDPDGIKVAQANRYVVDLPWSEVHNIEVEDATTSIQRSKTRQRVGRMGGVFKFAQFVPVAETKTITDQRADVLIESDCGGLYLQLLRTEHRVLKGWLMRNRRPMEGTASS